MSSEYPMLDPGDPPLSEAGMRDGRSEADVRDGRIKGCNHIRCRDCGQIVKQIPHAIWKRPWPVGPTLREAYVVDAARRDARTRAGSIDSGPPQSKDRNHLAARVLLL